MKQPPAPAAPKIRKPAPVPDAADVEAVGLGALNKAERGILTALYWFRDDPLCTPNHIALFAGYKIGGHTSNIMGGLRTKGLVQGWMLTAAGRELVQRSHPPKRPSGATIRETFRGKLNRAQNSILDVLMARKGDRMNIEQLQTASGYTGGHFSNMLGSLRSGMYAEGTGAQGVKVCDAFLVQAEK
jgi:hypothetical protein